MITFQGGNASMESRRPHRKRRSCIDIAWRRAKRWQRRHGRSRGLTWLLFLLLLIWLAAKTPWQVTPRWLAPTSSDHEDSTPDRPEIGVPAEIDDLDPFATDTGFGIRGKDSADYLPPLSLGDAEIVRAVQFLIRNKGGNDGPVAKRMWQVLDQSALPLSVYLRDVQDRSAWHGLRADISQQPLPQLRPVPQHERRIRDETGARLAALIPIWTDRGNELIRYLNEAAVAEPSSTLKPPSDGPAIPRGLGID